MEFRKADRFDLVMLAALLGVLVGLGVLLVGHKGTSTALTSAAYQAGVQQQLMRQARLDHLAAIFRPAQQALTEQRYSEALLTIEEIARSHPGDPHGLMLKGEVQLQMGALHEGILNIARAVRLDSEYLEPQSPLSRRPLIEQLVSDELPRLRESMRAADPSPGQLKALQELRYLQSRLAGGCE